ncbi:hypothetical protein FIBSPDRAFT_870798 [Athelia psychrophila]|uniref:Uncharacterized protein n=1 Tax=Athelia psychrophila TaxID=1759441 RepID=A0A166AS43_9AGAM|nr:hypothetical protein FIBSPDRAFT_870798 [Fibularhizoctonia sp. CBS 109695]
MATPSLASMDIQGAVVVTYVYQLIEGEVRVEKVEWRKEPPKEPSTTGAGIGLPQSTVLTQSIPTGTSNSGGRC